MGELGKNELMLAMLYFHPTWTKNTLLFPDFSGRVEMKLKGIFSPQYKISPLDFYVGQIVDNLWFLDVTFT